MKHLRIVPVATILLLLACPPAPDVPAQRRSITMPEFTEAELAAAEPLEVVAATPQGQVERLGPDRIGHLHVRGIDAGAAARTASALHDGLRIEVAP